jgi:hypothetical protein
MNHQNQLEQMANGAMFATKCRISLITYAKMLNFGERGYCNILLNFGIQRVTRFQQIG